MYFEVKAFNGAKRRFENFDNIDELNTFIDEFYAKEYNKYVVKSFDSNGFRKRRFFILESNDRDGIKFLN